MSDADAPDDGGFDKEAEREKLREKFARDEEKRKATQRMSELLLKGATMTNRHCEVCGDPIFRQGEEEFCPTCRAEGREGGVPTGSADAAGDEAPTEPASATDGQSADAAGDQPTGTPGPVPDEAGDGAATDRHANGARRAPPSQSRDGGETASDRDATARRGDAPESTAAATTPTTGDLGDARNALVAAVTRHARAGAEADDPRTAKEHLAAAREAAEALSALSR